MRDEPDELRERWRQRSLAAGWAVPGDWWTPAVESVTAAVCLGKGMAVACVRLGRARGRAGIGLGETLDDLGALFAELHWPDPPLSLVRCAAEGWVDSGLMELAAQTCEDPLTGLTTLPYLRSRMAEVYRAAGALGGAPGTAVRDTHRLVVVDLPAQAEPWRRLARAIVVAHDLRAVFRGGETLTLVGMGRAAALVQAGPDLAARLDVLHRTLERTLGAAPVAVGGRERSYQHERDGFLIWSEELPASLAEAQELLGRMAR
ncbi:hypothetical protein ACSNOI_45530 [Actinomadura kijaniata]|uniref:hypothetical protein n=1 Tax=Actinomadura kijaniata TaxID=46161 RepID=UPI003F1CF8A7